MTDLESAIHHYILKHIIEKGHAPSKDALSALTGADLGEVQSALVSLQEQHALVLRPDQENVWVIHPFSATPTNFWIEDKKGNGWWGNCMWCSLGAAFLTGRDVTIFTTYGAEQEKAQIVVSGGELQSCRNSVGHFPRPIAQAWQDVHFFCSTCLLFKDESQVDVWSRRHGYEIGKVIPIEQIWELSKVWYGNHLDRDWKKPSGKEVNQVFESVGLTDSFWKVPESDEHY